jgi:hypothetical protein
LSFPLATREDAEHMWLDMALSFPTLHWLMDHLEATTGDAAKVLLKMEGSNRTTGALARSCMHACTRAIM